MPAAWAGVAVSAASAIAGAVGGSAQSGAISDGTAAANAIAQQAIAEGNTNRLADRAAYQPYVDQGTNALSMYGDAIGLNGADASANALANFQSSPGYGYQVQQGLKAIDSGAAKRGMLQSGATIKAEETLGNNLANQDFSAYLGRLNNMTGLGLQAIQGQAATTSTYNSLLDKQSSDQQSTITSGAGQQASIYGNTAQGLNNAVGLANKNGLFDASTWNTNAGVNNGTDGFRTGANGTNSAGANALQNLGFYKPIGSV